MAGVTTSHPPGPARRLLLVHAHPDDETINHGATMAKYQAEGAQVTLVTCTRGERGEVIPPELGYLVAGAGEGAGEAGAEGGGAGEAEGETGAVDPDLLGTFRVGELAAAMKALGVVDHRFLGDSRAPGRPAPDVLADGGTVYRDSGMAYD